MIVPVPVHPWPVPPEREALIRAAKISLDTDVKIRLVAPDPGVPTRVLAFGERPKHFCRWAPIRPGNTESVASIAAALRFVLEGDADERWGEAAWLSDVMGCDVRFSHVEEEGKVMFR